MSVVEVCAKCGGSGWKIVEREGISGAERCECAEEGREQRVLDRANIPPLYQNASVDPLDRTQLASVVVTVRGYDVASGTMDKEAYRSALEAEILVLDDRGAHRVTDWVEDTVTSIVTHRCNAQSNHRHY